MGILHRYGIAFATRTPDVLFLCLIGTFGMDLEINRSKFLASCTVIKPIFGTEQLLCKSCITEWRKKQLLSERGEIWFPKVKNLSEKIWKDVKHLKFWAIHSFLLKLSLWSLSICVYQYHRGPINCTHSCLWAILKVERSNFVNGLNSTTIITYSSWQILSL